MTKTPTPRRPAPDRRRGRRGAPAGDDGDASTKVKYDALLAKIAANKGRSSRSSTPGRPGAARARRTSRTSSRCTRSTPSKGLAVVSLSLDDPDEAEEDRRGARAFLKSKKATFPNYFLDESTEAAFEKLKIRRHPGRLPLRARRQGSQAVHPRGRRTTRSPTSEVERPIREMLGAEVIARRVPVRGGPRSGTLFPPHG